MELYTTGHFHLMGHISNGSWGHKWCDFVQVTKGYDCVIAISGREKMQLLIVLFTLLLNLGMRSEVQKFIILHAIHLLSQNSQNMRK